MSKLPAWQQAIVDEAKTQTTCFQYQSRLGKDHIPKVEIIDETAVYLTQEKQDETPEA